MQTYIYGLHCPIANTIRYVGKSDNPSRRLQLHIDRARYGITKHHCARWIKKLLDQQLSPTLEILATVDAEQSSWQDVEKQFIANGPALGWDLTNVTAGGEGVVGIDAESMRRRVNRWRKTLSDPVKKASHRAAIKKAFARPECKAKRSSSAKAAWADGEKRAKYLAANQTQETKERRSLASKVRQEDPEFVAKHSASMKAAFSTPEARSAQSIRSKLSHANPEQAARRTAGIKSAYERPEVRAQNSAQREAMNADPVAQAKRAASLVAAWQQPGAREARSIAIKAGWARRNAAKQTQ